VPIRLKPTVKCPVSGSPNTSSATGIVSLLNIFEERRFNSTRVSRVFRYPSRNRPESQKTVTGPKAVSTTPFARGRVPCVALTAFGGGPVMLPSSSERDPSRVSTASGPLGFRNRNPAGSSRCQTCFRITGNEAGEIGACAPNAIEKSAIRVFTSQSPGTQDFEQAQQRPFL